MTGISVHTLRNWERRFGIVEPGRTRADDRLFSDADVARLKQFKQLIDRGHPIGSLARMDAASFVRLLDSSPATLPPDPVVPIRLQSIIRQFAVSIQSNDIDQARSLIRRSAALFPQELFAREILVPLSITLRNEREAGRLRPLHWNLAQAELQTVARLLSRIYTPEPREAVVTGAASDGHDMFIEIVSALGRIHGWNTIPAGRGLGLKEIAYAMDEFQPDALIVVVDRLPPDTFISELSQLRRTVPRTTALIVTGPVAANLKAPVGISVYADLADLVIWFKRNIGAT